MKAIALISGGLDSILAARVITEQGIEVIYLNFKIPFCHINRSGIENPIAQKFGIEVKTIDLAQEYLEMMKNPRYGFGSNMNPCIDCKILMLARAKELMRGWGAQFVVTGEVLGQRPMSQHRQALEIIEKRSGLEGLIVRPLSAQLLDETIPEKEGWLDRARLLRFSGRSRRPQMELAREFEIENYSNPAGGCLLTDPRFAERLKELITHQEFSLSNIEFLKIGRHFRLSPGAKLVVGRNENENNELMFNAKDADFLFYPSQAMAGPTGLGRGTFNVDLVELSSRIICRYCDLNGKIETEIIYRQLPEKEEKVLRVSAVYDEQLLPLRI